MERILLLAESGRMRCVVFFFKYICSKKVLSITDLQLNIKDRNDNTNEEIYISVSQYKTKVIFIQ